MIRWMACTEIRIVSGVLSFPDVCSGSFAFFSASGDWAGCGSFPHWSASAGWVGSGLSASPVATEAPALSLGACSSLTRFALP